VFGISNEEEIEAAKKSLQSVHKRLCTPHIRFDLDKLRNVFCGGSFLIPSFDDK